MLAKEINPQVSVVILTYNEELNLPHALKSVKGWSDDVHVVDSGSTDQTLEIAKEFDVNIHYHSWENWADQRNWTLDNCALKYEWILFLDADEQLTLESQKEIARRTQNAPKECLGFHLRFDFYFLGRLVRNAMHPHLRLVRKQVVRWHVVGAREYCSAPGDSPVIQAKLIHNDHRGIGFWIEKQTRNAELEAHVLYEKRQHAFKEANQDKKSQVGEGKLRHRIREILDSLSPLFVRPILFFAYRLLFKTDFRDGWAGLMYAFFFGLWYPMMIDAKYMELHAGERQKKDT